MDIARLQAAGISPALLRLLAAKQGGATLQPEYQAVNEGPVSPLPPAPTAPEIQPGITGLKDIPDPTPEEEESLIAAAGRKTLSGLQWIGESLDKPGRALRGLLVGRPGELLDVIPFSDTMGLTTPTDDVYGRQLLETWGVLGENTPGFDAGDVAGFGAEVLLDPLNMVTLGGGTVARNVLKDGAKSAKALTAATKAAEIADGLRPLVSVHTPAFGLPLPSKIPFTDIAIPRVELPVRQLGEFGKGEKAARVYEALHYGQFSPNPYVRKVFSAIPEVTAGPIGGQKNADLRWEAGQHALDAAGTTGMDLLKKYDTGSSAVNDLAAQAFSDKLKKVKAVRAAWDVSDEVKSMVSSKYGSTPAFDDIIEGAQQGDMVKLADIYDEIATNQKAYGEAADVAKNSYDALVKDMYEQAASGDPFHTQWYNDTVRSLIESKDGNSLGDAIQRMKSAGFSDTLAGFDEAAKATASIVDDLRTLYPKLLEEGNRLGIEIPSLDDFYINYAHRRVKAREGSALANFMRLSPRPEKAAFQESRESWLKGIPDGTTTINKISRDAKYTATRHQKDVADAAFAARVRTDKLPEFYAPPQPGTYLEELHNIAQEHDISYATLVQLGGEVRAMEMEAVAAARAAKREALKTVDSIWGKGQGARGSYVASGAGWRKTVNQIKKADGDYTQMADFDRIAEALGMESNDAWEFLKNHADQARPMMSNEDIAKQALERYRRGHAAAEAGVDPGLSFDTDSFDTLADPTMYPDAAYGGKTVKRTLANTAYAMAEEHNLPVWWKYDDLMRSALAKSSDETLQGLSASDLPIGEWKRAVQKEMQARGMDWASTSDLDMFMVELKNNIPELSAIPILGQEDLFTMVKKFAAMPKEVLQKGLYDRTAAVDAVDYLLQYAKQKAGVSTLRSMLKAKGAVSHGDDAKGVALREVWKDAGLTDEGLHSLMQEIHGAGLSPKELGKLADASKIDPELAGTVGRYVQAFDDPGQLAEIMKWVDAGNATFKGTLTVPYPAFHNRNRISGAIANWVAGIWTGESQKLADDLRNQRHGRPGSSLSLEEGETFLNEIKATELIDFENNVGAPFDATARFTGIGANELPNGTAKPGPLQSATDLSRQVLSPFGELVADTKQAYAEGGFKGAAAALLKGRRRADGTTAVDLNPFGMRGALDPLGVGKRAGDLDEFGKPLAGAAKYTSPETTNAVYKAGLAANQHVEWMNRVAPYIALRKAGWSPAMAARKAKQVQFDYTQLSPIEKKVFKRVIPFYCVPDHSEILTRDGWKNCDDLVVGEEVLTYNVEKDEQEWQKCEDKAIFEHDQKLTVMENSRCRLQFTDDHRWPVEKLASTVTHPYGTYDYPAVRRIETGRELKANDQFIVAADFRGAESILTPKQARLLGWLVTDGSVRKKGNHTEAVIYQKKFVSVCEAVAEHPRPAKAHPNGTYRIQVKNSLVKELIPYLDKSKLVSVVTRLSREAAEAMYEAMYMGDGTVAKRHSDYLAAQHPGVRDAFRVLCHMLGRRTSETETGCLIHQRNRMSVAGMLRTKEHYKGRVWCPKTPNGTWVMRQNGFIIITGNTFMKMNLAQQLRLLAENPGGRNAQLIRAENTAAREGKGQGGYVPKYLAESFAVRLPGGDETKSQYFSQSGLLPFEEAFNRFSFDDSGFPLNVKRTAEKFLAQSHPLIQGPAEQIAGRQFWSGRRLDDLYQSPTGDPDTNFWLSKSPLSRAIGTVGGLFDPRKSALQKLFNVAIGGVKITDVNTQKQRLLETRDILEGDLAKDPAIAQFTGLYANDIEDLVRRYNSGDQEAARMLKLYLDMKQELKAIKAQETGAAAPAS